MTRRLAIDIEGNGENPSRVVELAIAELDGFRYTGRLHRWLVKPPMPINRFATRVHGITNSAVADAPSFAAVADEVRSLLGTFPIVGHGVRGDLLDLQRELPDWTPEAAYDTLTLSMRLVPGLIKRRLSALGDEFGLSAQAAELTGGRPHGARYDAVLCGLVAEYLVRDLAPVALLRELDANNVLRARPRRREEPLIRTPSP